MLTREERSSRGLEFMNGFQFGFKWLMARLASGFATKKLETFVEKSIKLVNLCN